MRKPESNRFAIVGLSMLALAACGGRNGPLEPTEQPTGGWREFISGTYDSPKGSSPGTSRLPLRGIDPQDLINLGLEIDKGTDVKIARIPHGIDPNSPVVPETESAQCDSVATFFGQTGGWINCTVSPGRSDAFALPRGSTPINREVQLLSYGTVTQIGRIINYVDANGVPQYFDQIAEGWGEGIQQRNEVKVFTRQ